MSDQNEMLRLLVANDRRLRQTETKEVPLAGSGTAFPSAPPAGFRFFRTDLGWECYYDGTRWLTVQEYGGVMGLDASFAATYAASTTSVRFMPVRRDCQAHLTRAQIVLLTGATNDGSHYWDIQLIDSNGVTNWQVNTSASAASSNVILDTIGFIQPSGANISSLRFDLITVGAPSAIIPRSPAVWYRLIVP